MDFRGTFIVDLPRILEVAKLYPEKVEVLPMASNCTGYRRSNDKHEDGEVRLDVPDEWIKSLKGSKDEMDLFFIVHIPRSVVNTAESNLVIPGA